MRGRNRQSLLLLSEFGMFLRPLLMVGGLAAAVGIPYVAFNGPEAAREGWQKMVGGEGASEPAPDSVFAAATDTPPMPASFSAPTANLPLEGLQTHSLAEVFNFQVITPNWVYQRWARKSTQTADLDFYGIRVPLVTGTRPSDLAGALTYYFNASNQLERICFSGRTGDTRRIVHLLSSQYGLRGQQPAVPGEQLYETRWNGKPVSQLRVRPAAQIWATAPHASFAVDLHLNRPGANRVMNPRDNQVPAMPAGFPGPQTPMVRK